MATKVDKLFGTLVSNVVREVDFKIGGKELEIQMDFKWDSVFKFSICEGQKTLSFDRIVQIGEELFKPEGFKVRVMDTHDDEDFRYLYLKLELVWQ